MSERAEATLGQNSICATEISDSNEYNTRITHTRIHT